MRCTFLASEVVVSLGVVSERARDVPLRTRAEGERNPSCCKVKWTTSRQTQVGEPQTVLSASVHT